MSTQKNRLNEIGQINNRNCTPKTGPMVDVVYWLFVCDISWSYAIVFLFFFLFCFLFVFCFVCVCVFLCVCVCVCFFFFVCFFFGGGGLFAIVLVVS